MAGTNKDQWVENFNSAIGGTSPQNANPQPANPTGATDKYEGLKNTSYKEMLDSKIQAAAVKEQSQKYVQSSLAAAGLSGQGIAESTKAGIFGSYQKAINAADDTHNKNLIDIETQRQNDLEAKGTDRWQSTMEMLQQARSKEDLDMIKSDFYDGFTDDQKKYFDYYYASYSADLADTGVKLGSQYVYNPDADIPCYDRKTGGTTTEKGEFDIENQNLNSAIAQGELARGSYIELANLKGQAIYLYYGNNGQLYYVNKATYDEIPDDKKFHIYGKENTIKTGSYKG